MDKDIEKTVFYEESVIDELDLPDACEFFYHRKQDDTAKYIRATCVLEAVYLSIDDVLEVFGEGTDLGTYCATTFEFAGVYGYVANLPMMEMGELFEQLWNQGYLDIEFERWCKQHIRWIFGLEMDMEPYSYQGESPYLKRFMGQDIEIDETIYDVQFRTVPFFVRYLVLKKDILIAVEDVICESLYPVYKTFSLIDSDRIVQKYIRNNDGSVELVSFCDSDYLNDSLEYLRSDIGVYTINTQMRLDNIKKQISSDS